MSFGSLGIRRPLPAPQASGDSGCTHMSTGQHASECPPGEEKTHDILQQAQSCSAALFHNENTVTFPAVNNTAAEAAGSPSG
jgi:hypothetical protein